MKINHKKNQHMYGAVQMKGSNNHMDKNTSQRCHNIDMRSILPDQIRTCEFTKSTSIEKPYRPLQILCIEQSHICICWWVCCLFGCLEEFYNRRKLCRTWRRTCSTASFSDADFNTHLKIYI